MATQLTIKDKTFGHILFMNMKKKKNSKNIGNGIMKKIRNRVIYKSFKETPTKPNIQPGTVLILLSKKLLGKKVILLSITESGLFVVTGPFSTNGISMRRVNPRYTITSGAKIDITKLNLFGLNDQYFETLKKSKISCNKWKESNYVVSHKIRQNYIDRFLVENFKKDFFIRAYLKTKTPLSLLK